MRFEEQDNIVASGEQATPGDAERCTSVDAFLCLLAELSVDDWLAIGDRPPAKSDTVAILDAAITDQRLNVHAWLVRDSVETIAFLARCSLPPQPIRAHFAMTRARIAAECAALAIVARPWLAPSDIAEVLSPFSAWLSADWGQAPRRSDRLSPAPNVRRR